MAASMNRSLLFGRQILRQRRICSKIRSLHGQSLQPVCQLLSSSTCTHCRIASPSKSFSSQVTEHEEQDDLYRQVDVEVKGHDPSVLNSYQQFVTMAANELNITIDNISTPPKVIDRMSVLKSAHVHKKHFVQYEMRTHYRVIELKRMTGSTTDTFLEYIQRNLPEGVAMTVTKYRLESLPPHVQGSKPETSQDPVELVQ